MEQLKIVAKLRRDDYLNNNPGFSRPRVLKTKNKKKYNRKAIKKNW